MPVQGFRYPVINPILTGLNIRKIMDSKKISVKDIQDALSLESSQAVYKWIWGQSLPTIDNLVALSHIFEVPIDNILVIDNI